MKLFITGGCKNGKSTFALRQALRLSGSGTRYYVATMEPCDADEEERVRVHQAARAGQGFVTIEQGRTLEACLGQISPEGTALLDSVTALLANEMFPPGGLPDAQAPERVMAALERFLERPAHAVLVSDYIYADGAGYSPLSEQYRRGLASVDAFLARRCDCVVEVCAGLPVVIRGELPREP